MALSFAVLVPFVDAALVALTSMLLLAFCYPSRSMAPR